MEFVHSPYKHELEFYNNVKQGNVEMIKETHNKYANIKNSHKGKGVLSDDPFKNELYHMIINTAIITRVCMNEGLSPETAYTLSDLYIREADKCSSTQKLKELNDRMVLDFASHMQKLKSTKVYSTTVKSAVNYICDNLHTKISTDRLAKHFGYNRSYFSVLFKKETGCSVGEFITKKRIETAVNMLISTEFSYSDIGLSLGFSSQSHFCQRFREYMGVTPKVYRQQNSLKIL